MNQLAMALLEAMRFDFEGESEGSTEARYRALLAALPLPSAEELAEALLAVMTERGVLAISEAETLACQRLG